MGCSRVYRRRRNPEKRVILKTDPPIRVSVFGKQDPNANLLAWYRKTTKPNTTKARIYQSKEMYYNTK